MWAWLYQEVHLYICFVVVSYTMVLYWLHEVMLLVFTVVDSFIEASLTQCISKTGMSSVTWVRWVVRMMASSCVQVVLFTMALLGNLIWRKIHRDSSLGHFIYSNACGEANICMVGCSHAEEDSLGGHCFSSSSRSYYVIVKQFNLFKHVLTTALVTQ